MILKEVSDVRVMDDKYCAASVNTTFAYDPKVPFAMAVNVSPSQEQTIHVVVKSPIESAITVHGTYSVES